MKHACGTRGIRASSSGRRCVGRRCVGRRCQRCPAGGDRDGKGGQGALAGAIGRAERLRLRLRLRLRACAAPRHVAPASPPPGCQGRWGPGGGWHHAAFRPDLVPVREAVPRAHGRHAQARWRATEPQEESCCGGTEAPRQRDGPPRPVPLRPAREGCARQGGPHKWDRATGGLWGRAAWEGAALQVRRLLAAETERE